MQKQRRRSAAFCTADQRFFLLNGQYNSSSTYFKILALFCDHTDQFASHLVGNPEDRFTRVAAHISMFYVQ